MHEFRYNDSEVDCNPKERFVKFYSFQIVIEKEPEDEGYSAYSATLPGCFSNGKTIEEAKRNMREAVQQHVESLQAHDL